MLFTVGLSWMVYWLLVNIFNVVEIKAALTTGLLFLVFGLLLEYHRHLPFRG